VCAGFEVACALRTVQELRRYSQIVITAQLEVTEQQHRVRRLVSCSRVWWNRANSSAGRFALVRGYVDQFRHIQAQLIPKLLVQEKAWRYPHVHAVEGLSGRPYTMASVTSRAGNSSQRDVGGYGCDAPRRAACQNSA